jgi:hypothetical protein
MRLMIWADNDGAGRVRDALGDRKYTESGGFRATGFVFHDIRLEDALGVIRACAAVPGIFSYGLFS